MQISYRIAKNVVRKALQFQRYSEADKDLIIKQLGDYLQMSVRNVEMVKQNITWSFMTERDGESPISFVQKESKVFKVVLEVLIYGLFTGITIYECYENLTNRNSTYFYIDGDDDSTVAYCGCDDDDCEICGSDGQSELYTQLLVGKEN